MYLQGLEATCNDKKKVYMDKLQTLLAAWEHALMFFLKSTPEQADKLFVFIQR